MIYIAMLRGINVSGKNTIKMEDLRTSLKALRLENLQTYIQSGNIVFETKQNVAIGELIQKKISQDFGFLVPVSIRTFKDFEKIIEINPFLKIKSIDVTKLHVTFLSKRPNAEALEKLKSLPTTPDQFKIVGKEVFLHCPLSYGETKLNNTAFEKLLSVQATTRNWKTINSLLDLARKNDSQH